MGSRILAAADVFTAITENRPYREGMSHPESKKIIENVGSNGELDRDILGVITDNFAEFFEMREDSQKKAMDYFNAFRETIKRGIETEG